MHYARRTILAGLAGAAGCTALPGWAADRERGDASALEQHGITWTFSRSHACGRYAQGDWWVVGPVEVTSITPESRSGERVRNGSMINPPARAIDQGYDSAPQAGSHKPNYRSELNVALDVSPEKPLVIPPGSSLVSSISTAQTPEEGARTQLRSAAVLTIVDAPPPEGSFRPPYCGDDKSPRWNVASLRRDRLRSLDRARGGPTLPELERRFERPWIDHGRGWLASHYHPSENMPRYGREIAITVGLGALMLNTDLPLREKERLLRSFVQVGIDLDAVARGGGEWPPDGGHASGRKLPILFAGLLLDDPEMLAVGRRDTMFGEDAQTFYVAETAPGVINGGHGGYGPEDVGLPEWGIRHATNPSADDISWDARYRTCCTGNAWVGMVLAAHVMGLREAWNHEALFDYQDRYMAQRYPERWLRSMSAWSGDMWDMHRSAYPPIWSA